MSTLNERAYELANAIVADADKLGITVSTLDCGTRIIDCGVKAPGGIEAGLRLAEVCLSGLGTVHPIASIDPVLGPFKAIDVATEQPVLACMASQYAGWEIKDDGYFAMGSGPMRAAAAREKLFEELGYREVQPNACVGVLETGKLPTDEVCVNLAQKCGVAADWLTLLAARTSSPAGTVQIVARCIETAMHKLHVLGFDLNAVDRATGRAPLPPIANDDLTAIGWTNDAILYGGHVQLLVHSDDEILKKVGPKVPSNSSADYGRPFKEIFKRYGGDFYRIDPMLFSPAHITLENRETGSKFEFGQVAPAVLAESFAKK